MQRLNTSRLLLRELQFRDVMDIFDYAQQKDIVDMSGMRLHTSIEMTKNYIKYELKKSETLAIVLKETDRVIGTVSLRRQYNDSGLDIRLISCIINPNQWGNGFAPEAIKTIIKYAFEDLNVHKLLGGHYSFNKQSESVNKKLGFVYEGTQRKVYKYKNQIVDALEYGMLQEDYKKLYCLK